MNRSIISLSFVALVFGSGCSSTKNTATAYDDDIYRSSKDVVLASNPTPSNTTTPEQNSVNPNTNSGVTSENQKVMGNDDQQPNYTEKYSDENGNTYITNKYYNNDFDYDDYYDYGYAVRLRRFHNPCWGFGFYDSYYTNSYWYDYNPWHWGSSIYLGYSWWGSGYYSY